MITDQTKTGIWKEIWLNIIVILVLVVKTFKHPSFLKLKYFGHFETSICIVHIYFVMKAIVRGSVYVCAILIIGAGGRVRLLRLFPIGTSVPFPASVVARKPTCTRLPHYVRKNHPSYYLASYFDNFHIFDSCDSRLSEEKVQNPDSGLLAKII